MNDYGRLSSVTSMLNQLSWPTLQTRRKLSRLQTLHNFFTNRYHLQFLHTTYQHHDPRDSTIHYILPHVSTTPHQNSYFSRTINDWNSLLVDLVEVADADIFRTGLQSLL